MRPPLAIAGTALASVVAAGLTALGLAPAPPASAATAQDIRVGTFNIVTVSADGNASGERKVWRDRRNTVIGQILSRRLDVVGVQEANQSTIYGSRLVDDKRNQYLDLRAGLNKAGAAYQVTSVYPYNCYKAWSSRNCHYRNRAASGDNRIIYNTRTMTLLYKGAYKYPHQVPGKTARYLGWAVFRVKATQREVLVVTTHLDPYSKSVRVAQWRDMLSKVNSLAHGRPVVVTGDLNTTKWSDYAGGVMSAMHQNKYDDVLNQRYRTNPSPIKAESTTHAFINSFNGWRRDVRSYSYWDDRAKTGNGVDWIWTRGVHVSDAEVVANLDERTGRIIGTIPSDHHMVKAAITVP
jgi:endonuclease/exonuclease/phosphatase family metal-dependent hydrolase